MTKTRDAWMWCKDNEKELALFILGMLAGMHLGQISGRHEK